MTYQTISVERAGDLVTVTVDRRAKLNALSELVFAELRALLGELARPSAGTRGMIVTGAGDRAFVAGADIAQMAEMTPDEGTRFGELAHEVTRLLESLPFPVIACVDGYALGGGCELAMACDYIYATTRATFGQPEVGLGLIPGFGGCVRLIRYVGHARAKELIYTGRHISADEACRLGLVNRLFDTKSEMLRAATESLGLIATRAPIAVAVCKYVINSLDGKTTDEQLRAETAGFRRVFASEDKKLGVAAFLAKRPPAFVGF